MSVCVGGGFGGGGGVEALVGAVPTAFLDHKNERPEVQICFCC